MTTFSTWDDQIISVHNSVFCISIFCKCFGACVCVLTEDNQEGLRAIIARRRLMVWLYIMSGNEPAPLRSFELSSHKHHLRPSHANGFPDKLWGRAPLKSIEYIYDCVHHSWGPSCWEQHGGRPVLSVLPLHDQYRWLWSSHVSLQTNASAKCNSAAFRPFTGRIPARFITMLRLSFIHSSRKNIRAKKAFRPAESGWRRLKGLCSSDHLKKGLNRKGWDVK